MEYPRVLVISNNGFSRSNSNGRTLGLLFKGWPKDKLAQFCITTDGPAWDICDNYFCVSDRKAMKSFFSIRGTERDDLQQWKNITTQGIKKDKRIKRTPILSIIRHFIWSYGGWHRGAFDQWVKEFSPEIVVVQSGDTAFPHDMARSIASKYMARLVFFNTEGIYFCKKNYLYSGFCDLIFFPIYHSIFKRSYKKAMNKASYAIYLNDLIKHDNDAVFNVPGKVIYNTSEIHPSPFAFNHSTPVISYFGNFGYDRSKVLVEVALIINSIGINSKVNVYGKGFPEAEQRLNGCKYIDFHGFVTYDKIRDVINCSDILLHVESQEEKHEEGLRYGFSTKIADCLSSGRPFLLYSSPDIACARYLIKNDCAWFASTPEELKKALFSIIYEDDYRARKLELAGEVARANHDLEINSGIFKMSLCGLPYGIDDASEETV